MLKVHQRCNLACDYCYVYELADQSWRDRPRVITPALWQAAARRIGEHATRHELPHVRVTLHGGEPLLAGIPTLVRIAASLRAAVPCRLTVGLQTNGATLDASGLAALAEAGIRVAVSLDGAPADHDRHRRLPSGAGSFQAVSAALSLLRTSPAYAGLLCVIDPTSDPIATYEALLEWSPPAVDFLLPHATWASPPGPGYGAWLAAVFDRWYDAPRRETSVRLFEDLMSLLLGGPGESEQAGLSPVSVAVIETDGAIEQVDALKSTYAGAAATGHSVLTSSFDDVLLHPGMAARQIGAAALAPSCLPCPAVSVCGAGHYAHRYRPGSGFRHPTVYCEDMFLLIEHIRRRLISSLSVMSSPL
ncbi:FxsB family cyclophane-forming radical SAM/SPASM peptide maturase [Actinoplanes sp. RD1]|uniref:FxsB family cyclophane-forming radical SAM/SPASM peptide maturase n=1 Tax=Actinoplanes sp. RD1 TaxID=3064538 RepID=UPI002740A381|nr:FxsB family cyclophane-forming radical SAM/SPASM peptide maturase [Actinoplanes sp. RD1]